MLLEITRILTTAMQHPTYGINAQIATLPLLPGDDAPPTIQLITDDTRNGEAARGRLPNTTYPVLSIGAHGNGQFAGEFSNGQRDGTAGFAVHIGVLDSHSEKGIVAIYNLIRCAERTLYALMDDEGARYLNGIQLVGFEYGSTMTHVTPSATTNDGPITGGLILSLHVRDTQP